MSLHPSGFHTLSNVLLWLQGSLRKIGFLGLHDVRQTLLGSSVLSEGSGLAAHPWVTLSCSLWSQANFYCFFSALWEGSGLVAHPWVTLTCSQLERSAAQAGEAGRHLECRRHCLRPDRIEKSSKRKQGYNHLKEKTQQTCVCNPTEATACEVNKGQAGLLLSFDMGQDRPGR